MSNLKSIFIGCVSFSAEILSELIKIDEKPTLVITKKKSDFNSDFLDLTILSQINNIEVIYADDINGKDIISEISIRNPDIIFCIGWSSLIKNEILSIPLLGVVGFHPSLLPFNRGRHPIIWALALGLEKTGSTFFIMDEGADTGDIISQKEIIIDELDNASSLYVKITKTAKLQIREICLNIRNDQLTKIKQNISHGNFWRKRSKDDGKIDFRMTTNSIFNLIRALNKPYPGAHVIYKNNLYKVWHAEKGNIRNENFEPGKVLDVENSRIHVKTGDSSIWLCEHEILDLPQKGNYFI